MYSHGNPVHSMSVVQEGEITEKTGWPGERWKVGRIIL